MRYRNVKTGAIIDVPSKLGGNWELINGGKPEKSETATVKPVADAKSDVDPAKKSTRKTSVKAKTNK